MLSIYNYTGFHSSSTGHDELAWDKSNSSKKYNLTLISGILPIIGIVVGSGHICIGLSKDQDFRSPLDRIGLVARGIIEILGGGILFLIPDLIITMHRFFCASRPPPESTRFESW